MLSLDFFDLRTLRPSKYDTVEKFLVVRCAPRTDVANYKKILISSDGNIVEISLD